MLVNTQVGLNTGASTFKQFVIKRPKSLCRAPVVLYENMAQLLLLFRNKVDILLLLSHCQ